MRHRLRGYFQFRHRIKGKGYHTKKSGLYFNNVFSAGEGYLITPAEVIKLRDFLSRYINFHIHQKDMELYVSSRKHARAIEQNMLKAEAKLK